MSALARRLSHARVVVCAGAGGVGKTTVSAAVGIGLAAEGRRVAVVTIDPARRLAEALGLEELGNEPRRVDPARFGGSGIEVEGELWAMMLDVKRTFDELIELLAPDARTREEILANPIYDHLSTAIAGSQEYTAIAKLFEIAREGGYDAIVLDTPPSRNAVDFLDAPGRLMRFLEGRTLALLRAPTGRMVRAFGLVFTALRSVTGVALFADLTTFFGLLGGMLGGFRERAAGVQELLADQHTAFLIVTSPERAAIEEAILFAAVLERAGMRRCGVVVNRVHPLDPGERGVQETAARLRPALGAPLAEKVASAHADLQILARRDAAALRRVRDALGGTELVCLADRERDLHDVEGLVEVYREMLG